MNIAERGRIFNTLSRDTNRDPYDSYLLVRVARLLFFYHDLSDADSPRKTITFEEDRNRSISGITFRADHFMRGIGTMTFGVIEALVSRQQTEAVERVVGMVNAVVEGERTPRVPPKQLPPPR